MIFAIVLLIFLFGCLGPSIPKETSKSKENLSKPAEIARPYIPNLPAAPATPEENQTPKQEPQPEQPSMIAKCSDSDNGQEIGVRGITRNETEQFEDLCFPDGKRVKEFYCDGDEIKDKTIICPEGRVCREGVCADTEIKVQSCSDSDGKDFYAKGSVTADGVVYGDNCIDIDNTRDYYCENNTVKSAIKT